MRFHALSGNVYGQKFAFYSLRAVKLPLFILIVLSFYFIIFHCIGSDGTQVQCECNDPHRAKQCLNFDGNILFETIEIEMRLRTIFVPRIESNALNSSETKQHFNSNFEIPMKLNKTPSDLCGIESTTQLEQTNQYIAKVIFALSVSIVPSTPSKCWKVFHIFISMREISSHNQNSYMHFEESNLWEKHFGLYFAVGDHIWFRLPKTNEKLRWQPMAALDFLLKIIHLLINIDLFVFWMSIPFYIHTRTLSAYSCRVLYSMNTCFNKIKNHNFQNCCDNRTYFILKAVKMSFENEFPCVVFCLEELAKWCGI